VEQRRRHQGVEVGSAGWATHVGLEPIQTSSSATRALVLVRRHGSILSRPRTRKAALTAQYIFRLKVVVF
jgi:hypothetical protein